MRRVRISSPDAISAVQRGTIFTAILGAPETLLVLVTPNNATVTEKPGQEPSVLVTAIYESEASAHDAFGL